MKRIIALILALVMTVSFLAACNNDDEGEVMGADNPYKPSDIVLKGENFSITRAELSIAFYQYYMDFSYENENIDFYNIDTETSLKEQVYYDDVTWFDYFADMAVGYLEGVLILCEAAKAAGVELSEEDIETIDEAVAGFVRYANDYDIDEKEYFKRVFGVDADKEALREYYKKETLALKYEDQLVKGYEVEDSELSEYVEKNKKNFYTIDYISYTFDEDNDKDAKVIAEELAKITDPAAFDAYILSYMTDTLELDEEKRTTKDCYYSYKYYDEYSDFSKWAFDGAKAGTTYVKSNEVDGKYTVYLLTKAPELYDEATKNICSIVIDVDSHSTTAIAKTYAEDLVAEWKKGEATEKSFSELAKKESDDAGAKANGGYINGLSKADTLPEGLADWLYDSETVPGSTIVVQETGFVYAIYFVGDGEIKWEMDAKNGVISEKYAKTQEELEKKHKIELFEEVKDSLSA